MPLSAAAGRGGRIARSIATGFMVVALLWGCASPSVPSSFDTGRVAFNQALTVGTVTGTSPPTDSEGYTSTEFEAALSAYLRTGGLLTEDASRAKYRIEADITAKRYGLLDVWVNVDVTYRISDPSTNSVILTKRIQSATRVRTSGQYSPMFVSAPLTGTPAEAAVFRAAYRFVAQKDLEMFFDEFLRRPPQ